MKISLFVASTDHNWLSLEDGYEDIKGFCKSTSLDEVAKQRLCVNPKLNERIMANLAKVVVNE